MPTPVLDTNILLRHLLHDSPNLSTRATEFIREIENGSQRVRVPETVVFEAVFVLEKQQRQPRKAIMDRLLPIIEFAGVELRAKPSIRKAFGLYVRFPSISFADAYHAQLAIDGGSGEIVSFDQALSRVPGINHIEPK